MGCGAVLSDDLKYCPYCGTKLDLDRNEEIRSLEPADKNEGYRIILISTGSCKTNTAKEVLIDLLGYTSTTARELLDEVPVEIADELNERQAIVLAQALSEYGMEVTIVDQNDTYVNFSNKELASVFDKKGALVGAALAVLSGLTAINRVHRYRKYRKPSIIDMIFAPQYTINRPYHIRRNISLDPEPRRRITIMRRPEGRYLTNPRYRTVGPRSNRKILAETKKKR